MREMHKLSKTTEERKVSNNIEAGSHSQSLGAILTHEQYERIYNACLKKGHTKSKDDAISKKSWLNCFALKEKGIKVFLFAKHGQYYRIRIQLDSSLTIDKNAPTGLLINSKDIKKMTNGVDRALNDLNVPLKLDSMKMGRIDLTINIIFSSNKELMEYIRLLKKGRIIAKYKLSAFDPEDNKAKDPDRANEHSYCISCKSASFFAYDKIDELEMVGRIPKNTIENNILRLEIQFKRPALKKHLGEEALESNEKLLSAAIQKSAFVVAWYLKRMQPDCRKYLRYKDALTKIKKEQLSKHTRERMLYLLRKTSDCETLNASIKKMKEKFSLSKSQCDTILKKFSKLGFSPITLTNDSEYEELPSFSVILSKSSAI